MLGVVAARTVTGGESGLGRWAAGAALLGALAAPPVGALPAGAGAIAAAPVGATGALAAPLAPPRPACGAQPPRTRLAATSSGPAIRATRIVSSSRVRAGTA